MCREVTEETCSKIQLLGEVELRWAEVFPKQAKNHASFLQISLFFLFCGWDGGNTFW